jgi:hypothetical protein
MLLDWLLDVSRTRMILIPFGMPPLLRVQQPFHGYAHLLGVVLGNVRVGEFLRHGCGCVRVVCDMWRDDKEVLMQERMCES